MKTLTLLLAVALSACSKTPTVKGVKVVDTSTESTVSTITSGTVEAEQQAVLNFGAVGRVAKIHVRLGDRVVRNQILAELDNSDLRSILNDAQAELSRSRELFRSGLIAKAALDAAIKNFEVARANFDKSQIRAPFAGIITELNLQIGEVAQPSNPNEVPIRLIDEKARLIKGEIDEVDLGRVKNGQKARVKIPALQNRSFQAQVERLVPYISTSREQDRSAQVELRIVESSELVPVGASADVEILVDRKEKVPAIPTQAVQVSGKQRFVYQFLEGRAERKPVQLGVGNYDRSEVIKGLSAGDIVLLPSEETELKDGLKVKVELQAWP